MGGTLNDLVEAFVVYVPQIVGAVALALAGFVLAILARRVSRFLLRRVGFDRICESTGIAGLMREGGIRGTPTGFAGTVVFWAVLALTVSAALGPLGLTFLSGTVNQLILYAPRVLVAVLIVVLGTSVAGFLARLAGRKLPEVGVSRTGGAETLVRLGVIFVAAILAAAVLGIDVTFLIVLSVVALGAVALAAALALGLGLRNLSQNVAAGRYISEGIAEGDEISMDGVSGTVERVGHAMTVVRGEGGRVYLVPNSRFLEHVVEKQTAPPGPPEER